MYKTTREITMGNNIIPEGKIIETATSRMISLGLVVKIDELQELEKTEPNIDENFLDEVSAEISNETPQDPPIDLDAIENMDKFELEELARTKDVELDRRKSQPKLVEIVKGLFD